MYMFQGVMPVKRFDFCKDCYMFLTFQKIPKQRKTDEKTGVILLFQSSLCAISFMKRCNLTHITTLFDSKCAII